MRFSGKAVVVTGAGAGMGRATALHYAREGARVLTADIDEGTAGKTAEEIRKAGGEATPHQVDVSAPEEARAMVQAAVRAFGRIDVLANVAGIYPSLPIDQVTEEHWDLVLGVDLKGPFFAAQAAVAQMKAQGDGGVIVNVASGAAFHPYPGLAAYSAAKGGLVAVSRTLAAEAAPYGIRVNTVVPGPTATPGLKARRAADPGSGDAISSVMTPEQIAETILWCSSDAAGMVNGALLRVDGGHRML